MVTPAHICPAGERAVGRAARLLQRLVERDAGSVHGKGAVDVDSDIRLGNTQDVAIGPVEGGPVAAGLHLHARDDGLTPPTPAILSVKWTAKSERPPDRPL